MDGWIARMENALATLAARLDEPPSLEELASAANVSPFHFHRIWRAMTGETVARTIARLRIANAQQRLAEPDASVTSVAMETGFGTSQSFARAFRRVTGMSPTEFLSNGAERITAATAEGAPLRIELRERAELVVLRREGGAYRELNELFWQLWNWAEGAGKLDGLQGIYGIPLDDPVSIEEHRLRYDACLAFTDPGKPPAAFARVTLPAGDYAVVRHHGSYEGLEASNQRAIDALLALARDPADFPLFHHFLDDPEEVAPEALRTDILIRLVPAENRPC
ncbi:AraC family transcriptional regulator [Sphingomonas azotifigens]|uniref:AraC family transcriptional regulator n=1 Tax=Sphingomonas azotifigens TaxID=330920 RepID=UPI0009FDE842|nr:GyrI-like domain-containing protein [Sphingomonas azotifigens]